MNQSDLQIWCTPGNTNHRRVPINKLYPFQCHQFYLVWCDISKSHCEEDPSNYAGLKKRNNCRRWKRFFVPRINLFTWLWRYWYISSCILCLIYQRSAKSKQPVSRVPILAKFSNDFWLNYLTFSPFQSLTAFFLNDSRQKKC